jgi:hypothetical protein
MRHFQIHPRSGQRGFGWLEVIAVVLILIVLLLGFCAMQSRGTAPDLSGGGIAAKVRDIVQPILSDSSVPTEEVKSMAEQIARSVITASLEGGKSKEELRAWCDAVLAELQKAKLGQSNDERLKIEAAREAIRKVCDELLKD